MSLIQNNFCEQWATLNIHLVNERGTLRTRAENS